MAAPGPLLVVASLAGGDEVDATTVSYLLMAALVKKKEEEERKVQERKERVMQEIHRKVRADEAVTDVEWAAWKAWRGIGSSSSSGQKRKRKKRRKKKLPRGRARRRQWQRLLSGALIVDSGRGMCRAGFPSSRCFPFGCRQAQMLGIMAGMTRRTRMPLVSGSHLFAVLLGSTVDTCYVSLQRLWGGALRISAMLGSTVAPGDDFLELFEFSAMLGSTVALGDDFVAMVVFSAMLGSTVALGDGLLGAFRIQRNAWFNSLGDDFVAMVVFSAMLGSTVAVPQQGVPQVQLLDKVLVPVVCYDRPSCSRQFRNPWRSHRCRPSGCNGGSMDYAFTLAQQFVDMPAVVQRQVLVSACSTLRSPAVCSSSTSSWRSP